MIEGDKPVIEGPGPGTHEGEEAVSLEDLFGRLPTSMELGLDRVRRILHEVGAPQTAYPSVHIAGTNGKGSTAAILSSVIRVGGNSVGLYTSPHLRRFSERIRVDGAPASDRLLRSAAATLQDPVRRHGATYFEAATVLALQSFQEASVDVAVIEVGLGGRLDATNVIDPVVSGITNIDIDHAEWLGSTPAAIAREKGGIIKPRVPLVTTEQGAAALAVLRSICAERGSRLVHVDAADVHLSGVGRETRLSLTSREGGMVGIPLALPGRHQGLNAALALRLGELLPENLRPAPQAIMTGCGSVRWPGRFQIEQIGDATCVLDSAHNPAGVVAFLESFDAMEHAAPLVAVVGMLADKDWSGMLPPIVDRFETVILTCPPSADGERQWDPVGVARTLGSPKGVVSESEFGRALDRGLAAAAGGTLVVTGSAYTVGGAMEHFGIDADLAG